ncbi:GT2 family glycosyltransferase [Methylocaldum szegediense]|uniref:GT2 family glycosyltransferase n=2 Tax=Methylocaldum szegediense TaxID=73780 RepID=A0ABN8X742_9GAMM|nr:GT2 family glycosyltransferase [Methylocaldum szegediense]
MDKPIVGLTLNYRDAERTSRCIASLLDYGAAGVVVWDNSEDSNASAQELRQRWVHEPRVIIKVSARNLGFAAGVNRGIEAILTRWPQVWVMLINNDAVLQRGALSSLASALTDQPSAVIAYPRVDHGGRVIGTIYYQRWFAVLSFDRPWPGSFPYPSGSALLIAPERIELPLFDEDFFMYGEDVMLGWRLGAARMTHVPQVLVWHEGSASSRNGSVFYETRTAAGHWLLAHKLARSPLEHAMLLSGRMLGLGARAVARTLRSRSLVSLQALLEGGRIARRARH